MTEEQAAAGNGWKWIFKGARMVHNGIEELPAPPPWRSFDGVVPLGVATSITSASTNGSRHNPDRGQNYLTTSEQIRMVNAALYLRRPLLITGKPGTGKSSLAYAVAYELQLGPVLRWPITSRSTLAEGLYRYDAIGRLQEVKLDSDKMPKIERYLQLGPLGTALLPAHRPQVLLIDEIDKSDIDLPNDLLNIFEEGEYEIPELTRYTEECVNVRLFENDATFPIMRGKVKCNAFPFVVLTSNGEREFPSPFLRRCLRLDILPPGEDELAEIVKLHFRSERQTSEAQSSKLLTEAEPLIADFLKRRSKGDLATDQLLNVVYLITRDHAPQGQTRERLIDALLKHLGSADIA